jgi:hypothetical protein
VSSVFNSKTTIQVNEKKFEVYPHFQTMISPGAGNAAPETEDIFKFSNIPTSRRIVLQKYLEAVQK